MSPEGSLAVVAREILRKNGIEPAKHVNLVVMGGDEVRFPALQTKSIQATLFSSATRIKAQRDGIIKLAKPGDYLNLIKAGWTPSAQKSNQIPPQASRLIHSAC